MVQQTASLSKHSGWGGIFSMMKTVMKDASKRLSFVFWLIFLHSFFVGLALIFHPPGIMRMFGFHSTGEGFFPVQGGVFHILMGIFYMGVVMRVEGFNHLVYFSIVVKLSATLFLFYYYIIIDGILIVLICAIVDGVMGFAIILANNSYKKQKSKDLNEGKNEI